MAVVINIETFLDKLAEVPAIDVRSPSEYVLAHIPGVSSLPLFNDEERAIVGTLYKQKGKEVATLRGMDFAGPRMSSYVMAARKIAPGNEIMVHCWRGGNRSKAMAFTLEMAGFKTYLLEGGYRSFRRMAQSRFEQKHKLIILGGMTGSGKTAVLPFLEKAGEQFIDLEGLAHHKGSAFGAIGQEEQPSTEHFSNKLYMALRQIDPAKPLWLEDESHEIGKVSIPHPFYLQMREAKLVCLEISREQRAERLVREYTGVSDNALEEAFKRIEKRLGGQNLKEALDALKEKDYYNAALISLHYYDKAYNYGISKRPEKNVFRLDSDTAVAEENAKKILTFAEKNKDLLYE